MSEEQSGDDVLHKADEFIRRRRAQLGGAGLETSPLALQADDIPVLTEVVDAGLRSAPVPADSRLGKEIETEVGRELDAWLDENLPQAIMHVLDGVTDKLIQQVHDSARADLLPRLRRTLREREGDGEH